MSALPTRADLAGDPSRATLQTILLAMYDMVAQRLAAGTTGAGTASGPELELARSSLGAAASGPVGDSDLTMATNRLLGRTTASSGAVEEISVGTGLSLAGGVLSLSSILRNYLDGLRLSTAGASTTVTIAPGQAADSTNSVMLALTAALSKTTSAWAVGSGNGGLDEGTIANNTWYYTHLIQRPDTGVVDAVVSQSHGESSTATISIASPGVVTWTDHGLGAGAGVVFSTTGALPTGLTAGTRYYVSATGLTANSFQVSATKGGASINTSGSQSGTHTASAPPALPENYTRYRGSIGGLRTNGSGQWTKFIQTGDEFWWDTGAVVDFSGSSATAAALLTCTLPKGRKMRGIFIVDYDGTNRTDGIYISDPDRADSAPSRSAAPMTSWSTGTSTGNTNGAGQVVCWTNSSGQVRHRALTVRTGLVIGTAGWVDQRGRNT